MGRIFNILPLLALVLQTSFLGVVETSHFRGIMLSWKATDNPSTIDINWRISFRRSSGVRCDESNVGSDYLFDGETPITCDQCTNYHTIQRVMYQCTDYSVAEDWKTGVGGTNFTVEPELTSFDISFSSCCWISLGNGGEISYKAQAHVDLTPYNGVINSSPVTSGMAMVRVQQGCQAIVNIPVMDPDDDVVKCRWPSSEAEGDGVYPMPNTVLDESNCALTINAASLSGWYGVTLVVEDFVSPYSVTPKSKVPLQFLVNVYGSGSNPNCTATPELIDPTPDQGSCYGVAPGTQWSMQVRARAFASQIIEIDTTSPVGMNTSSVSLVPGTTDEYYITSTWTPTSSQLGPHVMCFNALDADGHTSEDRCVYLSVKAPPTVVDTWPAEGSNISTSLGLWTFQFDRNVTLVTTSTSVFISSMYGTEVHGGDASQTAEDTIEVFISGTLNPGVSYSVSLSEGVAVSCGPCPIKSASHDVSVYAVLPAPSETIRLVDGWGTYEGRVEIFVNGSWGTVCDDGWGFADAVVACRQLGFVGALEATGSARFGQGTGNIWLDDVGCSGSESRLVECPHWGIGSHNCRHYEDAGVVCQATTGVAPTTADARTTYSVEGNPTSLAPYGWRTTEIERVDNTQSPASYNDWTTSDVPATTTYATTTNSFEDNPTSSAPYGWRTTGLADNTPSPTSFNDWLSASRGDTVLPHVPPVPPDLQDWSTARDNTQRPTQAGPITARPPVFMAPTLAPTMDCSDSGMTVYIPRSVIGDTLASHLHFLDPACVGSHHNGTHIKMATTYNRCGTFMEVRGENVIFFNVVRDEAVPMEPGSAVTRDRDIEIPVQCTMDLEGIAELSFRPDTSKITFHEDGFGSFNFSLSLYHGNGYTTPYLVADYPVHVTFGDKLYFEARTWTEPGLELFVHTCRATPTSNPDDFHRYSFITEGCIEDDSVVFHPTNKPDVKRFEIDVFAFIDSSAQPEVFVHCDMLLCNSSDQHSRCAMGCPTVDLGSPLIMHRRHARSASGSHSYAITQGPIFSEEKKGGPGANYETSTAHIPLLLTTVCLLVGCVLVLGGVVAVLHKRNKRHTMYQPVSMDDAE